MENFYVTYDASSEQPRVGLSYNFNSKEASIVGKDLAIIAVVSAALVLIVFVVVAVVTCRRKK